MYKEGLGKAELGWNWWELLWIGWSFTEEVKFVFSLEWYEEASLVEIWEQWKQVKWPHCGNDLGVCAGNRKKVSVPENKVEGSSLLSMR